MQTGGSTLRESAAGHTREPGGSMTLRDGGGEAPTSGQHFAVSTATVRGYASTQCVLVAKRSCSPHRDALWGAHAIQKSNAPRGARGVSAS